LKRWHKSKEKHGADIARLRRFKAVGRQKSILLVGNGPSSASLPEDFVTTFREAGGHVMAMNFANLNPALVGQEFDYYVSADRRVVAETDRAKELRRMLGHQPLIAAFVPEIRVQDWRNTAPTVDFYPFCRVHVRYLRAPSWGFSPLYPKAFEAHTGLHSLQMACWMGYERIYVIGLDNSYVTEVKPGLGQAKQQVVSYAGNQQVSTSRNEDTVSYLRRHTRLFQDYWRFSEKPVFNLAPFSLTDCFPFITAEEALEGHAQTLDEIYGTRQG
jgi:hypothetical protein